MNCLSPIEATRTAWRKARFGMMIHWGLYSLPAGRWKGGRMEYVGEWIMSRFRIPIAEYEKLAAQFNPCDFDADEWCHLAKRAGMGYLIFTAKHHDGFAMFHSKVDAYNVVDATPFARDPVAELAVACQRHGLQLGLYYSQSLDWHEPDAGGWEEGNGFNHGNMPWANTWDFSQDQPKSFSRYFERKVKPQIQELLTQYGAISHLWFDCPFTISKHQSQELYQLAKKLQPGILINSRLGNGLGDIQSLGDNLIPTLKLGEDWEAVGTLNDTWGYKEDDHHWKTSSEVLEILTGLASVGVNYLMNIGPDRDGAFPCASVAVLNELTEWRNFSGESISNTEASPFPVSFPWGYVTTNDNRIFLHVKRPPEGYRLVLPGLLSTVTGVRLLRHPGLFLTFQQYEKSSYGPGVLIHFPKDVRIKPFDVVELLLDGSPCISSEIYQQSDGGIRLPTSIATIHIGSGHLQDSPTAASSRFEPDGSKVLSDGRLQLSELGATSNWSRTDDWLAWTFNVWKPGKYRVRVLSASLMHGIPCETGHEIEVRVGAESLISQLDCKHAVESAASHCYPQAYSECGCMAIGEGIQTLALKARSIVPKGAGLNVLAVDMIPSDNF